MFSKTFPPVRVIFKQNKGSKKNVQYQYYVQAVTILFTIATYFGNDATKQ